MINEDIKSYMVKKSSLFTNEIKYLETFGITYVERVKITNTGFFSLLGSNLESTRRVYDEFVIGTIAFDFSNLEGRYIFSDDMIEKIKCKDGKIAALEKIDKSKDKYDIRNLFQIINIVESTYEAFIFGTNQKHNLSKSAYINLISSLESYVYYIQNKYFNDFKDVDQKILLPNIKKEKNTFICSDSKDQEIIIDNDKYYIDREKDSKFYITKKEFKALYLIILHTNRKKVADKLKISLNTLNTHIQNACSRNECYSLSQLIDVVKSSQIKFLIPHNTESVYS
jgi:DNA-binding CsgD family transcriptional regulator